MAVELAPEEHGHQLGRRTRLDQRVQRLAQTRRVMVAQLAAPAELHEGLGAAAVTPEMREARLEVGRPAAAPGELRVEPLRLRAPELGLPPRREPARVADVVRMEMRDEHATHGPAVEAC